MKNYDEELKRRGKRVFSIDREEGEGERNERSQNREEFIRWISDSRAGASFYSFLHLGILDVSIIAVKEKRCSLSLSPYVSLSHSLSCLFQLFYR